MSQFNSEDISDVAYFYQYANQTAIGCWNKEFFCLAFWKNNVCKQISYLWIFQHKVGTGDMPGKKIMWFIGVDLKHGAPLPKKILGG